MSKKQDDQLTEANMFEGLESGFEGTNSDSFKTPFMKILQQLSPELKRTDPKYVEGAQSGQFCNSATNEVWDELDVVVLKIEHVLVVWKPNRGGFVGRFPKAQEESIVARQNGLEKWTADGDKVIDTMEFYCMDINNPSNLFIFPLSTTSLKCAKTFATRLRLLRINGKPAPVTWAGVWKIKTVEESNDKGSWYTIGSTPEFVRVITIEEKANFITPAKDLLKKAETDYSAIESSTHAETKDEQY